MTNLTPTGESFQVPCTVCFNFPCSCKMVFTYPPPPAHTFQPHPERVDILFCPCCGDVKQLPDPPS